MTLFFTKVLSNRDGRILASKWEDSYTNGCTICWFRKHNVNLNNPRFPVIFFDQSPRLLYLLSFFFHPATPRNNISIVTNVVFKAKFLFLVSDVLVPTVDSL